MRNNSPLNFNCEFAPDIVDFIYGETGDERRKVFSSHLINCSDCADEVAELSDITFSIRDWKSAEFDKLATPNIQIPYPMPVVTMADEKTVSWLDSVKGFFRLSPVLSGAMAVLLLGLMVGLGFFILDKNENQLVAETNSKNTFNPKPSASPEKSVGVEERNLAGTDDSEMKPKVENKIIVDDVRPVEAKKSESKQKMQAVRAVEKNPVPNAATNTNNDAKVTPVKKKPRLNELPEETEDDSLRLADLFAELDTK